MKSTHTKKELDEAYDRVAPIISDEEYGRLHYTNWEGQPVALEGRHLIVKD
jgi:hypothetical protein